MVLLAGVTGSGKSTTIASMLNWINHRYRKHILTLEDPIEFVFTEDKCLINQREIGLDVVDFEIGMKHAVREDPDVMLVGEMRDKETFMTAIHAAETGHLVFGTIHASSAASTIGRILDLFPQEMHSALRSAIAINMKGIVAQKLLKSIKPGVGRVPTVEIMTFNADGPEADPRRGGPQAGRRDPHRRGRRHAGLHAEPEEAGRRRADRPRGGDGSGAQSRSAEDGAQGHRSATTWNYLMRRLAWRWLAWRRSLWAGAVELGVAGAGSRRGAADAGGRRRRRPNRAAAFGDAAQAKLSAIPWSTVVRARRLCVLLVLVWVATGDWVNRDSQIFGLGYKKWNPIVFFPFAVVVHGAGVRAAAVCRSVARSCASCIWPRSLPYVVVHNKQRAAAPDGAHRQLVAAFLRVDARQGRRQGQRRAHGRLREGRRRRPVSPWAPADPNEDNANLLTARQSPGYLLVKDLVADMATRRSRPRAAGVRPAGASPSSTRSTACGTTARPATARAPT